MCVFVCGLFVCVKCLFCGVPGIFSRAFSSLNIVISLNWLTMFWGFLFFQSSCVFAQVQGFLFESFFFLALKNPRFFRGFVFVDLFIVPVLLGCFFGFLLVVI